ncbi:hypothetical protein [Alteribacter aurantiacus]|uniref:SunI/YnzG family protein n=1 Tax=Alteribacter aurantiacus TaxID=254410 RepID=UPI0004118A4E|nr:hypothetical protein [Alteribacter aurantiacus]
MMMQPTVKVKGEYLHIRWQFSKVVIKLIDIIDVSCDVKEKGVTRIGLPYGQTETIAIKTTSKTYLLYTSKPNLKQKIESSIEEVHA